MSKTTILIGDCRERLKEIPNNSIRSCITSPPYFGLRDYGTASWIGGSEDCNHKKDYNIVTASIANSGLHGSMETQINAGASRNIYKDRCGKCGATRIDDQIGQEDTVSIYVSELVSVFSEIKRVLTDDGTLWLNLGDSFSSSERIELPRKNLYGIPWRVAFALQESGWILRSDIIWHKPNPMPEPVKDRPGNAHEYLFLMAKSPKYVFNHLAIQEKATGIARKTGSKLDDSRHDKQRAGMVRGGNEYRNSRSVWTIAGGHYKGSHFAVFPNELAERCILAGTNVGDCVIDPFGGSGTVGLVANRLERDAILVELNPEYAKQANQRITDGLGMFSDVTIA